MFSLRVWYIFQEQTKLPEGEIGPQNVFVDCIRVNIFSDCLEQDANAVLRAFRFLRNQDFFKSIDKKKYHIWNDFGGHFRNKIFLRNYRMMELFVIGTSL
jgi:hypothetical protein